MSFADVLSAVDMQTGEVLTRVGLWLSVLHHRDNEPPWYVQWADQHLMVLCLVGFVRQEIGLFKAAMRPQINTALEAAGHQPLGDDGFKSIVQAVRDGYNGCMALSGQVALLTVSEREACRVVTRVMLESKGIDPAAAGTVFNV